MEIPKESEVKVKMHEAKHSPSKRAPEIATMVGVKPRNVTTSGGCCGHGGSWLATAVDGPPLPAIAGHVHQWLAQAGRQWPARACHGRSEIHLDSENTGSRICFRPWPRPAQDGHLPRPWPCPAMTGHGRPWPGVVGHLRSMAGQWSVSDPTNTLSVS